MNATDIIRRAAKPIGAFVLLGALTLVLSGCDRHHGSIHYYNDDGYYSDARVHRAPPVVSRHHPRHPRPPVFRHGPRHCPRPERGYRGRR